MKYRKMTVIGAVLVLALALGTTAVFATTPPETEETGTEQDYASMTTEELAYCDLDRAPDEAARQAILDARRQMIFSTSWTVDGQVAVMYADGTIEELPEFYDIFPEDWEVPSREPVTTSADEGDAEEFEPVIIEERDLEKLRKASEPIRAVVDARDFEELIESFDKTGPGETDGSAERVVAGFLKEEPEISDPE